MLFEQIIIAMVARLDLDLLAKVQLCKKRGNKLQKLVLCIYFMFPYC
jgi:hypothetical protein